MTLRDGVQIPEPLEANCRSAPERRAWLERLPDLVREATARWSLTLGPPFAAAKGGAAWVAPARRADGTDAVLKLGMPHMEGDHEVAGLRVWDGEGAVRLLAAEEEHGAMLLERCRPGTPLREASERTQDAVIAGLLGRLWRVRTPAAPFRSLSAMTAAWAAWSRALQGDRPPAGARAAYHGDAGLLEDALQLLVELPRTATRSVLLHTDLHAGNVLRAEREPWLAIDPKPFLGDPAYDATQHLLNVTERLRRDPDGTVRRFADLLGVDAERVRMWTFARLAIGGRGDDEAGAARLARRLARAPGT